MTVQLLASFTTLGTGDILDWWILLNFCYQSSVVLINAVTGTINNPSEVNLV